MQLTSYGLTLSQQWKTFLVPVLLVYILLVHLLRDRRAKSLERRFSPAGRASFCRMTTDDAQAILKDLTELEFPKFFGFSIIFALFKTYGIPSVSSLLVATGQLVDVETASKRIADTGVLLLEFALNEPTSERATQAIARMNYLHAGYQKAGKITNDDMLYTLSLFALEPARWVRKYEWRKLTELELCACGTYWKSMGDAMDISYSILPSSIPGWKDGLQWLDEVEAWSLRYEEAYMVPAVTNKQLADSHLEIICMNVPARLLNPCKKLISVILGERLRTAMMYPESPQVYHTIINGVLGVRKLLLRYLALPRPEMMRKHYIPSGPDQSTGRYNAVEYLSYPWYVEPNFSTRWGPRSWITRLVGRKLPGDDGNKYLPEGWTHTEIGPKALRGKGIEYMEEDRKRLNSRKRGGCPFALG